MLMDQKSSVPQPVRKPGRAFRIYLLVSSTLILIAAIYSALIFYSRYEDNIAAQQRAAEKKRAEDQRTLDMMGGNTFDILSYYASPGHISRGETVQLCYGVANAKSVSLDPPDAKVYPAYSNCVTVKPRKTTTYTLTAVDAQGNNKTGSLTITVK
jgi:hypothetical protein